MSTVFEMGAQYVPFAMVMELFRLAKEKACIMSVI